MRRKLVLTVSFKFFKPACLALSLLFLLTHVAQANAPAPPTRVWFTFDYEVSQPITIEGIQFIECQTPACDQPVLLHQYGTCNSEMCLTPADTPEGWSDKYDIFKCTRQKCYTASNLYDNYDGSNFKLIIQFSDRVRISKPEGRLPGGTFGDAYENGWRVKVTDTALSLSADDAYEPTWRPFSLFLISFGFTQFVELLVAATLLRFWLRRDKIAPPLLIIFLANFVTFPLVWFFFPALEQFQSVFIRNFGLMSLLISTALGLMLVFIYRAQEKSKKLELAGLTFIIIVVLFILCNIYGIIISYGNYDRSVLGLPANLILPLSEIVAFGVETILITVLSKKAITWKQAVILSLVMNATSLVLGPILLG